MRTSSFTAKRIGRFLSKYGYSYAFVAPMVIVLLIFFVIPLGLTVFLSFGELKFGRLGFVGLDNYRYLFCNPSIRKVFLKALENTVFYTIVIVPYQLVVALFLATLIHQLPPKVQSLFRGAYYLPVVCSAVIISLIWVWLYDQTYGLLNHILGSLGLGPFSWIQGADSFKFSFNNSLFAIMLSVMLTAPGMAILFYLAAMSKIPRELYESAEIDGGSKWQQWIHITVPLLKPITLYLLVIQTIASFQVFDRVFLMTSGGPGYTSATLAYILFEQAFGVRGSAGGGGQFGVASALGVILLVIIALFAVFQFKFFSSDVEY